MRPNGKRPTATSHPIRRIPAIELHRSPASAWQAGFQQQAPLMSSDCSSLANRPCRPLFCPPQSWKDQQAKHLRNLAILDPRSSQPPRMNLLSSPLPTRLRCRRRKQRLPLRRRLAPHLHDRRPTTPKHPPSIEPRQFQRRSPIDGRKLHPRQVRLARPRRTKRGPRSRFSGRTRWRRSQSLAGYRKPLPKVSPLPPKPARPRIPLGKTNFSSRRIPPVPSEYPSSYPLRSWGVGWRTC